MLLSGAGREATLEALRRTLGPQGDGPEGNLRVQKQMRAMVDSLALSDTVDSAGSSQTLDSPLLSDRTGQSEVVGRTKGKHTASSLELFTAERYRRPLLIGTSLMLFQQVGSCASCDV